MENQIKIVVFHVDVPKEEDIKNNKYPYPDISSSNFKIKSESGAESTWKLSCFFNCKRKILLNFLLVLIIIII